MARANIHFIPEYIWRITHAKGVTSINIMFENCA